MAYVVPRRNGRFEIRESLHTPEGPRARTLAGFDVITDEILAKAAGRAKRPFDPQAVLASSRRAGAPVAATLAKDPTIRGAAVGDHGTDALPETHASSRRFVEASRWMADSMGRAPAAGGTDPGTALIDLLGFADAVTRNQPARPFEPLTFPVLTKIIDARRASGAHRG